ncbi:MAG TPA: metallophosphoesterase [Thermoanaerobaculia bacterium]
MSRRSHPLRSWTAVGGLVLLSSFNVREGTALTRGPYLGRVSDSAVAVAWDTDLAGGSRVDFAPEGGGWATIRQDESTRKHVVVLDGLASGESYRYRIYSGEVPLAGESSFRAPRDRREARFRFAVIGDTSGVDVPLRIADRLVEADVDFALHMGDVVYPSGAEKDYDAQFFTPLARWLSHGPVLPTLGNHDVMTDRGAAYLANFSLPVNDATGNSRFYAFRHANALFVSLDVESLEFGAESPQYEWLVRTLSGSAETWKFVYLHTPPYSSAHANGVARLILCPLFERYGVDVVLAGHEHLYERTHPIRAFASSGPGVIYLTEGGGGANLSQFRQEEFSAYVASRFSYVIADVEGSTLTLSAREPDGSMFDSVVVEKSAPNPPRPTPKPPSAKHPPSIVVRP